MHFVRYIFLFFCIGALCLFVVLKNYFVVKSNYVLQVNNGDNINFIAKKLEKDNIINSATLFKVFFKVNNLFHKCQKVHIGEYELFAGSNFDDVINMVCKGLVIQYAITIPEGLYTSQIIDILNNTNELGGDKITNKDIDEGILLPETYYFAKGFDREELLLKMKNDLQSFLDTEWQKRDADIPLKSKYEVLILASIVEAEAKNDAERPIIASVYINRLRKKMRLQADPTTIYEITKGKYKMPRLLTLKDLQIKGDWNTYRKYGLPKTPICNAGEASILATLHPARTDYLYFVAKKDLSGHIFAKDFQEHFRNKSTTKN